MSSCLLLPRGQEKLRKEEKKLLGAARELGEWGSAAIT